MRAWRVAGVDQFVPVNDGTVAIDRSFISVDKVSHKSTSPSLGRNTRVVSYKGTKSTHMNHAEQSIKTGKTD